MFFAHSILESRRCGSARKGSVAEAEVDPVVVGHDPDHDVVVVGHAPDHEVGATAAGLTAAAIEIVKGGEEAAVVVRATVRVAVAAERKIRSNRSPETSLQHPLVKKSRFPSLKLCQRRRERKN